MMKATLKGLATALILTAVTVPALSASVGAGHANHIILATTGVTGTDPVIKAQSYGTEQLVPQSVAWRIAMRHSPPGSKGLAIKLKNRSAGPVYVVKVRTAGQVHRVVVDARNGRVLRRN